MKRFTLIFIATLVTMFAWAQTPLTRSASPLPNKVEKVGVKLSTTHLAKQLTMRAPKAKAGVPRKAVAADDIVGDYTWDYQTGSKIVEDVSTAEASAGSAHVVISASETTEGGVTISGMFPNDLEATLETEDDVTAIVITPDQTAGTSSYGDYTIQGIFYYEGDDEYEAGWYNTSVVGLIGEGGIISFLPDTWITRVLTTGDYAGYNLTPYWLPGSTFTPAEALVAVTPPEGIEAAPYVMTYDEGNKPVNVIVDGNDVYFQGLSDYLPKAWVLGTKDGNTVTFPAMQYMGFYVVGDSYMFYEGDAVFTYDEEAGTYSATGTIYGVLNDQYYDGKYTNPVLTPVVEKAAMPADPSIEAVEESSQYGWYAEFNVPLQDVDGEPLVADKLSFVFYADANGEVTPLTFTPETHSKLTESMTEIPFGFTEGNDFYTNEIYFNDLFSTSWKRIGIKSIYRGGGETNETEIQWFELSTGEVTATFDFNSYDVPVSSGTEANGDYDPAGEIIEDYVATEEDVTLVISPAAEGKTATRWWKTNDGPQLRCYGNTLTFSVPEEMSINTIVFNYNGKYWGGKNNGGNVTADSGEIEDDADSHAATWTGEAQTVVFTIGANTQINSIDVTYTTGEGGGEEEGELVELPEGVDTEVWTIEGIYTEESSSAVSVTSEMAFDGTDVYLKGLPYYFEDAWLKGTLNEEQGIIVFPSGQYVGTDEYGSEYMVGFNDETYEAEDIVFAYDEARQNLYQVTPYILECPDAEGANIWGFYQKVILYPGEAKTFEPVAVPEGLKTEDCLFTAMEYVTSEDTEESEYANSARGKKAPRRIAKKDVDDEEAVQLQEYTFQIKAGVDGKDVYFQGFTDDTSEFWAKGTLSEDGKTVTIPANQFLGTKTIVYWTFNYYLAAVNEELEPEDIVLTYDAETGSFSTSQTVALHDLWYTLGVPYQSFTDIAITKLAEFAATPADPVISSVGLTGSYPQAEFVIPATDVEDNAILTSKLFYTIWIEKDGTEQTLTLAAEDYDYLDEDMTEIPYTYNDNWDIYRGGERVYFNQGAEEIATWTKIGVQSIYYGGGECNKSNVVWYEIGEYNGIADVTANGKNAAIYDMQGRRVTKPANGLFIMNGKKILVK